MQGWDLQTRAEFLSYKQGFQRPVLMIWRRTLISNVTTADTNEVEEGRTGPLADIGFASEKEFRQIRPCRHLPLEKLRDVLLRHVRIAPRDDGAESTAPPSMSAQSTSTSDLSITLIPHWSCSPCLTEYTAHVSIMREDPSSSSSSSAESQPPRYCLDTTAWINLGTLNFYSRNSKSNFGRYCGDDRGNTKSWLVKSSDWVFNNGEPWVRSPRRVWEEEDRWPRLLWLVGIAVRGLVGVRQRDVQSWSGLVLSVLLAVVAVMLAA